MHSRPLLDYLAYPEEFSEAEFVAPVPARHIVDPLEARLKDLEARLRANDVVAQTPKQDLTLSAQVEAILKRREASPAATPRPTAQADFAEQAARPARVVIEPPPTVPVSNDAPVVDQEFLKFSEAVYLIGQAAKRFTEQAQPQHQPQPQVQAQPAPQQLASHPAPSTIEIEALSAVLRETVSAFRSVADDLAVSAGEIRHYATREERAPPRRRPQPVRYRDDDEIVELRESIADLQDRLDDLLHARRRGRY
jgi:hypothetical protein